MTQVNSFKFIFLGLLLVCSCRTAHVYRPTLDEVKEAEYRKVSLQELLQHKVNYQGQYIETEGYFHYGFEECAIYYNYTYPWDTTRIVRDYCGLWVDFHPYVREYSQKSACDSLQDKFIRLKGLFDTTRMSAMFCGVARLNNAFVSAIIPEHK